LLIAYLIISKYQYISKDLFYITYAMYSDPWNANKIEIEKLKLKSHK